MSVSLSVRPWLLMQPIFNYMLSSLGVTLRQPYGSVISAVGNSEMTL